MKKIFILLFLIVLAIPAFADEYVNGYYKRDGSYVQPHYRSSPDNNSYNNWSSRGNVNPYTGQEGYKNPDSYSQGQYVNPYRARRRN